MKFIRQSLRCVAPNALAAVLALPVAVCASDVVTINNPWARATVAGQKTAAAYMELVSSTDAALVGVASAAAEKVELHTMSLDGGVMKMRPLRKLELPAAKAVKLAPGGLHVMLIGIRRPLKEGDSVQLVLTVETKAGQRLTLKTEAPVRAMTGGSTHTH